MKNILNSNWMPWNSWPSMAVAFLVAIGVIAYAGAPSKSFDDKHGIERLPTGQRVFEVQHDGVTYLVIEKHNGIGICPKVER